MFKVNKKKKLIDRVNALYNQIIVVLYKIATHWLKTLYIQARYND